MSTQRITSVAEMDITQSCLDWIEFCNDNHAYHTEEEQRNRALQSTADLSHLGCRRAQRRRALWGIFKSNRCWVLTHLG